MSVNELEDIAFLAWMNGTDLLDAIANHVRIANPLGSVDKIYEMRKAHTLRKLERDRKKEARKREEKRLSSELKSLSKGKFPKEQASATVAWNMTHPFQGGRTGSK